MWGASATDVWAVGGQNGGSGGGFVWHYDGSAWTASADVPADLASSGTCWKVSGRASDDVWIAGTAGATLHWNGTALERMNVAEAEQQGASLFSVAGNSKGYVTVGGAFDGVLYENDGSGWKSALPSGGAILSGVAVSEDDAYAVGQFGTILRRGSSGWATEKPAVTQQNLHATWIDPAGGAWAVGGQFESSPTSSGVLLYKGALQPGGLQ